MTKLTKKAKSLQGKVDSLKLYPIDAALTIFGHWHMSRTDDRWISNGSLIGPTPYSIAFGLDPEPPSQTLFLIDRDRGKRNVTPIQVGGKDEWS